MTKDGYEGKKQMPCTFIILKAESAGFAKVPQEEKKGKYSVPDSAKSLTELKDQELLVYSYEIVHGCPKDKGQRRDDVRHVLAPGMIIRQNFWPDKCRDGMAPDQRMLPEKEGNFLPEFSVVRLEWNPKVCDFPRPKLILLRCVRDGFEN